MDYLTKKIEYLDMIREIEITGDEYLKVISKNPSDYLKRIEEIRSKIAQDSSLMREDKEFFLKKVNGCIESCESINKNDDNLLTYALIFIAGMGFDRLFLQSNQNNDEYISEVIEAIKDYLK